MKNTGNHANITLCFFFCHFLWPQFESDLYNVDHCINPVQSYTTCYPKITRNLPPRNIIITITTRTLVTKNNFDLFTKFEIHKYSYLSTIYLLFFGTGNQMCERRANKANEKKRRCKLIIVIKVPEPYFGTGEGSKMLKKTETDQPNACQHHVRRLLYWRIKKKHETQKALGSPFVHFILTFSKTHYLRVEIDCKNNQMNDRVDPNTTPSNSYSVISTRFTKCQSQAVSHIL